MNIVQRAKRLAPVDENHRTKASISDLIEDTLKPLNERHHSPESVTTLGEFVERVYIPYVVKQKRASTSYDYRNKWNEYLKPRCSSWWMREVRTCDVQHLLDAIAIEHDLSRTSLRHIKAQLSGIFNYAKQQGYFDGINPVQGTAIPKARPGKETYAYSLEEVTRILAVLPEPAASIVATAAFTGLKRGEIRGLLWENYNGHELRVTQSVWKSTVDEPKTAKSKAPVPVISQLRAMLDGHRARRGNPQQGAIFANRLGKPLCLNGVANRIILPVLHRCDVCGDNRDGHKKANHKFRLDTSRVLWHGWHAFRRGLATNLYSLGVPDKTIQAILRHANLSTTMNVYVKSVSEDSIKAMQALQLCAQRALESHDAEGSLLNKQKVNVNFHGDLTF
ncbi:MAG TPA: tyrosine-type recombinase/integrase [Terriglobales bacterium]